eukprot:356625-Chlamydomonas_euryale.AAC.4
MKTRASVPVWRRGRRSNPTFADAVQAGAKVPPGARAQRRPASPNPPDAVRMPPLGKEWLQRGFGFYPPDCQPYGDEYRDRRANPGCLPLAVPRAEPYHRRRARDRR